MRHFRFARAPRPGLAAALALALVLSAGCGGVGRGATVARPAALRVVAAENFWGSLARQLGGSKVDVQSIIVNPNTDPHGYQPTARDARAVARAQMTIVNGVGYDDWAPRLLDASPSSRRVVLNVGELLGLKQGENPHRWYFPEDVHAVIGQIVADYQTLDPSDSAYFAARRHAFEARDLARYDQLRREIRASYAGVPVGYSESIFQGWGADLALRLLTPYSFAKAVSEGTDVTAQDKQTVDEQAEDRKIKVWMFNSQNLTPDVQRVNEIARAKGIPIATATETLSPASDSFERWQASELEGLLRALRAATGR